MLEDIADKIYENMELAEDEMMLRDRHSIQNYHSDPEVEQDCLMVNHPG